VLWFVYCTVISSGSLVYRVAVQLQAIARTDKSDVTQCILIRPPVLFPPEFTVNIAVYLPIFVPELQHLKLRSRYRVCQIL